MAPLPALAEKPAESAPAPPGPSMPKPTMCPQYGGPTAPLWAGMSTQSWLLVVLLVLLGLQLVALKLVWETKARFDLALSLGWQKRTDMLGSGR